MITILDSNDKKELQENIDKKIEKPDIAVVGQVIAVEEVDEDDKPIKFKAINMSGGSSGSGSEEVDPTVYNWAKQPTKPSYTAGEVGALPASTFIPTMTSQLTNDSKYQTEDQVKSLINSTISGGTHFTFERVSQLPETGVENIIYLLGEQNAGSYIEYIWINDESRFEPIGSTDIDLSNVLEKSGHVPNMYLGTDEEGNVVYKSGTIYAISVDSYLSTESENPVQNKVVAKKINDIENNVSQLSEQKVDKNALSLGFGTDGKLYIMVSGLAIGDGVEIDGTITPPAPSEGVAVFVADFSGESPNSSQFYSWEGRVYDGAIYDSLENIKCVDGVANLTSVYDSENSRWIKQMMTTGGLFESDNFICKFKAKFCGLAGSWQNVITYGTGTHWTNDIYSDGIKWPAGGEIDAFEQAGAYSETPNYFGPGVHWGAGTNSGYSNTHLSESAGAQGTELPVDEWADFKFILNNGVAEYYVNDALIATQDLTSHIVDNNYLCNYKPFLKPQAFYIDGSCYSSSKNQHTDYKYNFEVSDFEIYQDALVECTGLEIYPQMWAKGTELIFPVGAELYLDRIYTPSNVSNKACTWQSNDESVATVVQGFVKTLKEGTATITATCGSVSATYNLVVSANANVPCAKVLVDESVIVVKGKTFDVTSYLCPSFTTENVIYTSNNEEIAIFENGTIKGIKVGQTTVIMACGTKSATISVDVLEGATPVIAYDLSGVVNNYESYTGETTTLPNTGSYGSSFDATLNQVITNYDGDNNYSVDGYIKNMNLTADVTGLNLRGVAHTVIYRGVKVSNNLIIKQLFDNNGNYMPSVQSDMIRYGNVNGYSYTFTEEITNIAVSSDGTIAKLFINGALVMSGSDGYSANNPTKLNIWNINGNIESFEIYMEQLSDAELIGITSIS